MTTNSFGSKAQISVGNTQLALYRLDALARAKVGDVETLPYSLRILLENLLRYEDGKTVLPKDIEAVAGWNPRARGVRPRGDARRVREARQAGLGDQSAAHRRPGDRSLGAGRRVRHRRGL